MVPIARIHAPDGATLIFDKSARWHPSHVLSSKFARWRHSRVCTPFSLVPRGAVGSRHDGLLRQPSPLLVNVCDSDVVGDAKDLSETSKLYAVVLRKPS